MVKINTIIGIDQSLTNTAITILDVNTKVVLEVIDIKQKPPNPFYVDEEDKYYQVNKRVSYILEKLESILTPFKGDHTLICIEKLSSGSSNKIRKSMETDYVLSHLFYSIIGLVDDLGIQRKTVMATSHKKVFFPPEYSKYKSEGKKGLHQRFWESSFIRTGFTTDKNFCTDDSKDAFCIAYFFFNYLKYDKAIIFTNRSGKQKETDSGRVLEALKNNICDYLRYNNACWYCIVYNSCKEKTKYKDPKSLTKANKTKKDIVRKNVENIQ